jgi:large conductance mechanosensitive channel
MKRPSLSALWQEFKSFAFKGNMIDLAVAVVIGAAFSGVINSLVKDVIMPTVTYVVTTATTAATTAGKSINETAHMAASKVGLTTMPAGTEPAETQPAATQPAAAAAPPPPPPATPPPAEAPPKPVDLQWTLRPVRIGNFIGELINFFLIAMAVFLIIVKLLGSVMKRVGGTPAPSEPTTKECPYCLSVIPIKARKCAFCTADLPAEQSASTAPGLKQD